MEIDLAEDDALPAVGRVWEDEGPKLSMATIMAQAKKQQPPAPTPSPDANVEPVDPADLPRTWKALLALLAQHGPSLQGLLSQGRFAGIEDGRAIIRYPKSHEVTVKLLERNGKRELITEAFTTLLNEPTGVKFELDTTAEETTAVATVAAPRAAIQRVIPTPAPQPEPPPAPSIRLTPELRAELESDPLIRSLIRTRRQHHQGRIKESCWLLVAGC